MAARPAHYPRFMRTLDEVTMVARHANTQVYDWRWAVGLFQLSGRNAMTTYPPPAGRPGLAPNVLRPSSKVQAAVGLIDLQPPDTLVQGRETGRPIVNAERIESV